jgi:hypothetical protein
LGPFNKKVVIDWWIFSRLHSTWKLKIKLKLIVIVNHLVQKKIYIRILIPCLPLLNPGRNLDQYNTWS